MIVAPAKSRHIWATVCGRGKDEKEGVALAGVGSLFARSNLRCSTIVAAAKSRHIWATVCSRGKEEEEGVARARARAKACRRVIAQTRECATTLTATKWGNDPIVCLN